MSTPEIYPFLHGFLSQWHPSPFVVESAKFNCAEQFMMFRKAILFDDQEMADKIVSASAPSDQKRLGQQVRNFIPEIWDACKREVVIEGNRAKFSQNRGLRKKLLATGDAILVEANPKDIIWGVGLSERDPGIYDRANWRGENLLGQILMQVRAELHDAG